MRRSIMGLIGTLLLLLGGGILSSCGLRSTSIRPVEQEQIENVVKSYLVRDTNIPDYEVTLEAVADNWARVSLAPAATSGEATTLYLQKQTEETGAAPTAEIAAQPGHEARVDTTTGWTIILGPQAGFAETTLDEAGVPETVRP